ncbi:transmembrane protein C1orf162 homolog isoform X1 [Equus przewalskii]|uniref:Transmembrane protein C1orf162 homolog isoform X1 n=2 Tax=Equus przewalskii TaxID=9798 RepID=A0ABM2EHY8_EQUPR|nr:transmembrane protein C1orf162 homolog isoform X1 [Equus caballus]
MLLPNIRSVAFKGKCVSCFSWLGALGEDSMGGSHSKPDKPHTTAAPTTTSVQCSSAHSNKELHLVLAFFAGVLLTLLLMALVFLIIKSYRKCHSSPQALDPRSDPAAKLSSVPEEALTYASMNFKSSEGKRDHLTTNHFSDSDPVVYAQIKATNSSCRSSEA